MLYDRLNAIILYVNFSAFFSVSIYMCVCVYGHTHTYIHIYIMLIYLKNKSSLHCSITCVGLCGGPFGGTVLRIALNPLKIH